MSMKSRKNFIFYLNRSIFLFKKYLNQGIAFSQRKPSNSRRSIFLTETTEVRAETPIENHLIHGESCFFLGNHLNQEEVYFS